MRGETVEWWGFRLRWPLAFQSAPLARSEVLVPAALTSTFLLFCYLFYLILGPGTSVPWRGDLVRFLAIPLGLALAPPLLTLVLSPALVERTWLGAAVILSRERGNLGKLDRRLGLLVLLVAPFLVWRLESPLLPSALLLAAALLVTVWGALGLQEPVEFHARQRRVEMPPWLRSSGTEEGEGGVIPPETGAARIMTLRAGAREYPTGVAISEDLLAHLRALNREGEGRLHHSSALALILLDRDPTKDVGRGEVRRLCEQLCSIAHEEGLSPYVFANQVLAMVQQEIRYAFDAESTREFAGGPFQEYGRFALETIVDGVGDCDCTSILAATLLAHLGHRTSLIRVSLNDPESGEVSNHLAVGIEADGAFLAESGVLEGLDYIEWKGHRFLYGETAVDGATLAFGSIPAEWLHTLEVQDVVRIPPPGGLPQPA